MKKMVDTNKDKKGRFIHGHTLINLQDTKTGKFTSHKHQDMSTVSKKNETVVEQLVDELLEAKEKTTVLTVAEKLDISFEKYIDALLGLQF